jgi:hypothetical protein
MLRRWENWVIRGIFIGFLSLVAGRKDYTSLIWLNSSRNPDCTEAQEMKKTPGLLAA